MVDNIFGTRVGSVGSLKLQFDESNLAIVTVTYGNSKFPLLLQSLQITRSEMVQPVTCFNDTTHIYCFGRTPTSGSLSGFCIASNSALKTFIEAYKQNFRAYKASTTGENLVTIQVQNGETIQALVTDLAYDLNAERPALAVVNMNFLGLDAGDTYMAGD